MVACISTIGLIRRFNVLRVYRSHKRKYIVLHPTQEEYLVGNRQMGLVPVCLSLFVSYQSAISLMGSPADTYNTGTMVFFTYLGICLSYVLGYFTVLPLVHPLQLTSVYHFLHLRFPSSVVRLLLTYIGMLQTVCAFCQSVCPSASL